MNWHGWCWTGSLWHHACKCDSIGEAHRELNRLHPGVPNLRLVVTGGHMPDWVPGRLAWEC